MEDPDPDRAPSGKEASSYGEVMVRIWITGDDCAEAMVIGDPKMPFDFYEVATSHLMALVAANSKGGYKKALNDLVKAAMTNKGMMIRTGEEEEEDDQDEDDRDEEDL